MFECPHCHKTGISLWGKLSLGPAIPTTCSQCGKKVGVPYYSLLAAVPFVISIIYLYLFKLDLSSKYIFKADTVSISMLIGSFIFYVVMHLAFVPLISQK